MAVREDHDLDEGGQSEFLIRSTPSVFPKQDKGEDGGSAYVGMFDLLWGGSVLFGLTMF